MLKMEMWTNPQSKKLEQIFDTLKTLNILFINYLFIFLGIWVWLKSSHSWIQAAMAGKYLYYYLYFISYFNFLPHLEP